MNPARLLLYFVGVLLVIGALSLFFMQTGLSRWIPTSLLAAGVLLIIGLAIMSFAETAPRDETQHGHGHGDDDGDVNIVNR